MATTTNIEKLYVTRNSSKIHQVCVENVPSGTAVAKAFFMVKEREWDADASAVISKTIFPGQTVSGQIVDDGSANGTAILQFIIDNDDANALELSKLYIAAVKTILNNGMAYTPPYSRQPVRCLPAQIDAIS